jgi:tRNA(fMet)-specific endonuclease VapC
MSAYLLDTNHAARAMAGEEPLATRLAERTQIGDEFYISITVLGELYFAAYTSRRRDHNLERIAYLLARVHLLNFDQSAAEESGRMKAELKAKGRPIPSTDAQIAAVARLHGLTVLTADQHFGYVDRLKAENWFGE